MDTANTVYLVIVQRVGDSAGVTRQVVYRGRNRAMAETERNALQRQHERNVIALENRGHTAPRWAYRVIVEGQE